MWLHNLKVEFRLRDLQHWISGICNTERTDELLKDAQTWAALWLFEVFYQHGYRFQKSFWKPVPVCFSYPTAVKSFNEHQTKGSWRSHRSAGGGRLNMALGLRTRGHSLQGACIKGCTQRRTDCAWCCTQRGRSVPGLIRHQGPENSTGI